MKKLCIIGVLLIIMALTACTSSMDISGKWYCEELQLYISFGDESPNAVCYLDYDHAEYIICGVRQRGRGLEVICSELNNARYEQYYRFLDGIVVSVKDDSFVVKDSGKKYTFKIADGVPEIDTTITTEQSERLLKAGVSVMEEGFLSDYPIPEMDYDLIFVPLSTTIEQIKTVTDVQYVKQKENHFYTIVNIVLDDQEQLTYIDFGWDLTFDHSWEIQYSEFVKKADLDGIAVGTFMEDIQYLDPQGDFSMFHSDKMRYNFLSYHAVQDEYGHGYGYWLIYDYHTPNREFIGIHQIDTY